MRIYNTSVYREAINTDTVYMTPTDVMRAEVTEELNGIYELEFDMLVSDNAFRYVKVNNLVMTRVSNDADVAEQTFRIYEVNKSINGTATVRCQHISYDANRTVIGKFSVSNVSFPVLVATITNNIQNDNVMRFAAGSNYPTSTYSYAIEHPKTLRDIMGGEEGSLLDRFHVEFSYDNNVTYIWKTRGTDKGVRIEYGKNLVDFNETITGKNVDAVQGYYFNEDLWPNDPSRSILGSVINLTGATDPNVYLVDVTEALKDEGLANTVANIDAKARDYAVRNSLDEAGVSLDASFIDLASTDEYRGQFKHQRIGLGDTVHIYVTNLGVEYSSRVKRSVYNVLTNNFDSLEIGEIEANLTDAIKDVQAGSVYMSTGSSIYYGYCTTAQGTAAKKVSIEGFPSVFSEGQKVSVKFQYTNTAANPTLSINEGTAIAIKRYGTTAPGTSAAASWNAGSMVTLTYDGTYWILDNWLNTTYSSMSVAEYEAGTSTSARLITPQRLKAAILHHATPANLGLSGLVSKGEIMCYANSRVDTFTDGSVTLSLSALNISNGAKPVGVLLTPQFGTDVTMKYSYDDSSANGVIINAWQNGVAYSGALRYFCLVFQGSWYQ